MSSFVPRPGAFPAIEGVLVVESGLLQGQRYPLDHPTGRLVMGREADCTVAFINDKREVSRKHAVVEIRPDGVFLTDLNSVNHTFLETGAMVEGTVPLPSGMGFHLGAEGPRLRVTWRFAPVHTAVPLRGGPGDVTIVGLPAAGNQAARTGITVNSHASTQGSPRQGYPVQGDSMQGARTQRIVPPGARPSSVETTSSGEHRDPSSGRSRPASQNPAQNPSQNPLIAGSHVRMQPNGNAWSSSASGNTTSVIQRTPRMHPGQPPASHALQPQPGGEDPTVHFPVQRPDASRSAMQPPMPTGSGFPVGALEWDEDPLMPPPRGPREQLRSPGPVAPGAHHSMPVPAPVVVTVQEGPVLPSHASSADARMGVVEQMAPRSPLGFQAPPISLSSPAALHPTAERQSHEQPQSKHPSNERSLEERSLEERSAKRWAWLDWLGERSGLAAQLALVSLIIGIAGVAGAVVGLVSPPSTVEVQKKAAETDRSG